MLKLNMGLQGLIKQGNSLIPYYIVGNKDGCRKEVINRRPFSERKKHKATTTHFVFGFEYVSLMVAVVTVFASMPHDHTIEAFSQHSFTL